MTNNELLLAISQLLDTKLDEKLQPIKQDIASIKDDMRRADRKSTLILDEVERVHEILDKHKADTSKHIA